jgi:hypothetical protein
MKINENMKASDLSTSAKFRYAVLYLWRRYSLTDRSEQIFLYTAIKSK